MVESAFVGFDGVPFAVYPPRVDDNIAKGVSNHQRRLFERRLVDDAAGSDRHASRVEVIGSLKGVIIAPDEVRSNAEFPAIAV